MTISPDRIRPCMGGFCHLREKCRHHVEPTSNRQISERLCEPGLERESHYLPLMAGEAA